MNLRVFLALLVIVSSFGSWNASDGAAELVFGFGRSGVPTSEEFIVGPGIDLPLDIFLIETSGTRLQELGVGSAKFNLVLSGVGVTHGATEDFLAGNGFVLASAGNELTGDTRAVQINVPRVEGSATPVKASEGTNYVLLGTAILSVDPTFETSSVLTAPETGSLDVTLGDNLDNPVAVAMASATITAVPEPGSVAGLAALVIGGAVVHRRRLRGRRATRTPRNC